MKKSFVFALCSFSLILLLHSSSIASQLFYVPTDEAGRSIVFACALFSFIICLVIYAVKKKRRQEKFGFTSFLGALFSDFWFDEFVTRKILSFIYFVWCFVCLTFVFVGLVAFFQLDGLGLLISFAYLLLLVIGRVVLESMAQLTSSRSSSSDNFQSPENLAAASNET